MRKSGLTECQLCGAQLPSKDAFMVIHTERNHPEEYAKMLRDYYQDLRRLGIVEQERDPAISLDDGVEIDIE